MADPHVQTALKDLLAGKACVDDSRTALVDYLESMPAIYVGPRAASIGSHLNAALHHLDAVETMLRETLKHASGAA
jgi:hypothetical protein